MKIIPEQYQCEICGDKYDTKEFALECENRPRISYPIGLIYGNHTPNGFYDNITFAVAENRFSGHANYGGSWACRDNGAGDNLGKEMCISSLPLSEYNSKLNFDHPTFKRMVAWLKSQNIPVTIWNGKEAVPYKVKS